MLAVQDISNSIYNDEIVQGKLVMVSWRRNGHNGNRANAGEISRIVIRRICDDIRRACCIENAPLTFY